MPRQHENLILQDQGCNGAASTHTACLLKRISFLRLFEDFILRILLKREVRFQPRRPELDVCIASRAVFARRSVQRIPTCRPTAYARIWTKFANIVVPQGDVVYTTPRHKLKPGHDDVTSLESSSSLTSITTSCLAHSYDLSKACLNRTLEDRYNVVQDARAAKLTDSH